MQRAGRRARLVLQRQHAVLEGARGPGRVELAPAPLKRPRLGDEVDRVQAVRQRRQPEADQASGRRAEEQLHGHGGVLDSAFRIDQEEALLGRDIAHAESCEPLREILERAAHASERGVVDRLEGADDEEVVARAAPQRERRQAAAATPPTSRELRGDGARGPARRGLRDELADRRAVLDEVGKAPARYFVALHGEGSGRGVIARDHPRLPVDYPCGFSEQIGCVVQREGHHVTWEVDITSLRYWLSAGQSLFVT